MRTLADDIIYAQDKEIAEMRYLIADIGETGEVAMASQSEPAGLVSAREALATEVVGKVDPEFLTDGDIAQVFPQGIACRYYYSGRSPAVLVAGDTPEGPAALVKISGDLVRLDRTVGSEGGTFAAEALSVKIRPADDEDLHDLLLAADGHDVGFRGSYSCVN